MTPRPATEHSRPLIVSGVDLNDAPEALAILESIGTVICCPGDRAGILAALPACEVYLASAAVQVDAAFLDQAPHLRLIASPHTGRDHLDVPAITTRGVEWFGIAEERALLDTFTATAELAFGLLLAVIRGIVPAVQATHQGRWERERFTGFQLAGKTLGIIGLGRLGTMAARIGLGFGMRVLACDVRDVTAPDVEMATFEQVLAQAHIVSVHVHLTAENVGLIGRDALARMRSGSILINTSRGRIVDEAALLDSLESGHLGGAGLDVIDGEWLSRDQLHTHPLIAFARTHDNLIISPHIGGATYESIAGARVFAARKIRSWLEG